MVIDTASTRMNLTRLCAITGYKADTIRKFRAAGMPYEKVGREYIVDAPVTGARDEFLLTATVQNLKRLAKHVIRPPPGPVLA
jgi:hypothetical protein